MTKEQMQYTLRLLGFTLAIAAITLVLFYVVHTSFFSFMLPYLILFFFATTLIIHLLLLRAARLNPMRFITRFTLVTFIKLMVYLGIIVVYLLLNRSDAVPFTVTFLILYVAFTIYEIVMFHRHFKKR